MVEKIKYNIEHKRSLWIIMLLILVLFFFLILALVTRAYLTPHQDESTLTPISMSSCLHYQLIDENNSISLTNTYPMIDSSGIANDPYEFSIKNTCDDSITAKIYLVLTSSPAIPANYVKVSLNEMTPDLLSNKTTASFSAQYQAQFNTSSGLSYGTSYILNSVLLNSRDIKDFRLRIWLDKSTPNQYMNKNLSLVLVIADSGVETNV